MENLTENSIKEKLKKILAKELKIELEDITDDSHIVNDIGAESADMILHQYQDRKSTPLNSSH